MRRRVLGVGIVAVLLAFGAWRWTHTTEPVSEAEARALLGQLTTAAQQRDFDRLCDLHLSQLMCTFMLDGDHLRESAPSEPPVIVESRYLPRKDGFGAGHLLVVEGRTSCGPRYRTEVLVVREEGEVRAVNGVFWSNAFIRRTDTVKAGEGEPPPRCPATDVTR